MKVKRLLVLSFSLLILQAGISLPTYGNIAGSTGKIETPEQAPADKSFESFLEKFTSSAAFQYSRVKFPLASPITLSTDNGDEKTYPFTKEKWPLLDSESLKVERVAQEEGNVYVAKFVVDLPNRKEYEAGYEESELDLRVVFDLIDGKWYVTDCYNVWYSYDLPINDLKEAISQVQEENKAFMEEYP